MVHTGITKKVAKTHWNVPVYGHHFRIFQCREFILPCVYIIFPCMTYQFPCTQLGYEYSQNTVLIFTAWGSLSQCSVSCAVPGWGPLAREKVVRIQVFINDSNYTAQETEH